MNLLSLGLAPFLLTATLGGTRLPLGVPPSPEDPALARIAPEDCLFYMSWAGTASPDPNSPNQTEQLLAEPEVQDFLGQMENNLRRVAVGGLGGVMRWAADDEDPDGLAAVRAVVEAASISFRHPAALFVSRLEFEDKLNDKTKPGQVMFKNVEAGAVISLGSDAARVRAALEKYVKQHRKQWQDRRRETRKVDGKDVPVVYDYSIGDPLKQFVRDLEIKDMQVDGHPWCLICPDGGEPPCACGFHGNYLVIATGKKAAEGILARMKQEPPKWLAMIREQATIERRSTLTYLNVKSVLGLCLSRLDAKQQGDARKMIELLGLDNAAALTEVSGLDGHDFAYKTYLKLDGPPRGLLRLISDRPLRPEDLTSIPRDATLALAFRLDLQQALETVLSSIEKLSPSAREKATRTIEEAEHALSMDLRHGVLRSLGDTWCVYNSPSEGGYVMTGLTAIVPVRDGAGLSMAHARLAGLAKKHLIPESSDPMGLSPQIEQFRFQGRDVYCLNVGVLAPACCMTNRELVFALSPQNVKAYLSRGTRHEPIQRVPHVGSLFAEDNAPAVVAYCDSPKLFELFYPWLSLYGPTISNGLREAKADVDLSLLPSAPSIGRHLEPSVATLRRTKHGMELDIRGTIPLPGPMMLAGLSALRTWGSELSSKTLLGDSRETVRPAEPRPDPKPATAVEEMPKCEPEDEVKWHTPEKVPILGPYKADGPEKFTEPGLGDPERLIGPPSEEEVLRLLEKARPVSVPRPALQEVQRNAVRIVTELLQDSVDPPRVYPLVGPAQLHHRHYKCKVYFTELTIDHTTVPYGRKSEDCLEVLYVDRDHLHMVGNVDQGPRRPEPQVPLPPEKTDKKPAKPDRKTTNLPGNDPANSPVSTASGRKG